MVDAGRFAESDRNPRVEIDAFDLRLPCRAFRIAYKVAEQGKLSLTTEFMLRLLRAADELREDGVAKFFGFNDEETEFAIDQAERFGYLARVNGRVHLTSAGHNLFAAGSEEPVLFQVVSKTDKVSFDLISFAPVEPWRPLTKFEFALPELPIASLAEVGQASDRVKQSFQRNFRLIRPKRSSDSQVNSLYTIDSIDAERRFETVLPVKVSVRPENPTTPEADLLSWKTGGDLDEREAVLNACGNFVRGIATQTDSKCEAAAKELVACAPDAAGAFHARRRLQLERLFSDRDPARGPTSDRPADGRRRWAGLGRRQSEAAGPRGGVLASARGAVSADDDLAQAGGGTLGLHDEVR